MPCFLTTSSHVGEATSLSRARIQTEWSRSGTPLLTFYGWGAYLAAASTDRRRASQFCCNYDRFARCASRDGSGAGEAPDRLRPVRRAGQERQRRRGLSRAVADRASAWPDRSQRERSPLVAAHARRDLLPAHASARPVPRPAAEGQPAQATRV